MKEHYHVYQKQSSSISLMEERGRPADEAASCDAPVRFEHSREVVRLDVPISLKIDLPIAVVLCRAAAGTLSV